MLAAIGITASVGRTVSISVGGLDYSMLRELLPPHRIQEAYALDRWFLGHPLLALLHVVPGAIFLAVAPLQFSSHIRNRWLRFHRWSGRVLLVAALLVAVSGLIMGALFPFSGPVAAAAVFVAGALFLVSLVRAFVAIRRGDVTTHREWMIRMFSLGLGIATVRIIAVPLLAGTNIGLNESAAFSFWAGWLATFTAAELWIRYTRRQRIAVTDRRSTLEMCGPGTAIPVGTE